MEKLPSGLISVPVPIPDNPLRYTLTYLVPGDDGLLVVDPGWNSETGWAALEAGLAVVGATTADVTGIVVTHVHPDHHGLTGRLRDASGAWVAMHPAERATLARDRDADPSRALGGWLRALHVPEEEVTGLLATFGADVDRHFAPLADADLMLEDGDSVPLTGRRLRVVWTPGHTPGHICLLEPDARVLLTGDHLLPRITPNIGLQLTGDDPLGRYLGSLTKVAAHDGCEALPAHEYRFDGIAARAAELAGHHRQRCVEIAATVERLDRPSIWQLTAALTWSRPWSEIGPMRVAAVAETAAHVELLIRSGELARDEDMRLVSGALCGRGH
ncbi:MBL fold metallo-hydrolase [Actinoplanes sp. NEAU-A11]|uniref:MBL fold metallo-hydrolase n=1 Tax=Actinoplanes aureus TaxID=2792083 RepID=A0A931FYY5_9ACTN|nr:MBL fold metallo-hydrolase [Actinoplanes aureus]